MAILGNNRDCATGRRNTGIIDCYQELGKPNGFLDMDLGWSANVVTDTIDKAYITERILRNDWYSFTYATDFVDNTEDDVYQTFSSGQKKLVRDGLPEFQFIFTEGSYAAHKNYYSHNSSGGKNVAFFWESGHIGFKIANDDATISGLRRGYLKAKFQNNDGTNTSQSMIDFQLTNALEYNTSMYIINLADYGLSMDDFKGMIETSISVTTPPAAGATTFSANVVTGMNSDIPVTGVLPTQFQLTGQTIAGAVYNTSTKLYDFTVDAIVAGEKTLSLGDGTLNGVDLSGTLYGGSGEFTSV